MMSQTLDEQLSALLDGELPAEQQELLLRRLDNDPELRDRFARYSLIGDLLTDHEAHVGALQIADRVRERLRDDEIPAARRQPEAAVRSGLLGAGLAAAAALVVVLNLGPNGDEASAPRLAGVAPTSVPLGVAPVAAGTEQQPDRLRANVAPARMTRYLVTHAEFANSASRQFVDSHIVMPAFQRVAWQTSGTGR